MRHSVLSFATAAVCVAATTFAAPARAQSAPLAAPLPLNLALPSAAATAALPIATSSSLDGGTAAAAELPDAPSTALSSGSADAPALEGQSGNGRAASTQPIAPKYAGSILPGQGAVPLSARDKVVYAFRDTTSPYAFLSRVVSATYSQAADSQPHYGQGWAPYGQRVGAAFARGTVQDLAAEAVFAPIFHDDPRYYVLGRQHKFFGRVVYAATRVVVTRTDSGHNTLNAPLLLGYAAAAGANFAYYPHRDRNFGDAATGYAGSLGGGVLGMEVSEFIDDALRLTHLRR